jgi:hypothetical protein
MSCTLSGSSFPNTCLHTGRGGRSVHRRCGCHKLALVRQSFLVLLSSRAHSFVSPSRFERHREKLGVEIAAIRRFNYGPEFPIVGKMLRLGLMALFRMSPALYYRLLPPAKRANILVGRGITRDHFIIVLCKLG